VLWYRLLVGFAVLVGVSSPSSSTNVATALTCSWVQDTSNLYCNS